MKQKPQVLFLHTNYPAQFRFLVKSFICAGWEVWFASHTQKHPPLPEIKFINLQKISAKGSKLKHQQETSIQVFQDLLSAKRHQGLMPILTYVHTGWGLGQFIKDLFPRTKMIAYSEWWFNLNSSDFYFDPGNPEIHHPQRRRLELVLRNQAFSLELQQSDSIISPTDWQRCQLPSLFKNQCKVIFDGIDSVMFSPTKVKSTIHKLLAGINPDKPLLTYATRGLEPYRGFPEFVNAAVHLLKTDPDWQVAIAGADKANYYHRPGTSSSIGYGAKAMKLFEDLNLSNRVHFLGPLPFNVYRDLLRMSSLHCYFTRPYVLSWSLLESSLVGCRLFCSETMPVLEFLENDQGTTFVDHTSENIGELMAEIALDAKLELGCNQNIERVSQRSALKSKVDRVECIQKHMGLVKILMNKG